MMHKVQSGTPPGWTWRTVFLSGFALVAILIVVLLGYLFFIRYTDLSSSGDANLPIWIGNTWGNVTYLLISVALMGLYLWAAILRVLPGTFDRAQYHCARCPLC